MDDDDDSQYHYLRYYQDLCYSKNTSISCRHFQRPPPPEPYRQSTWFELPLGWTHWQPAIVRCPQVTVAPKWNVCNDYGRKSNELMVRDRRANQSTFQYPLEEYTAEQVSKIPDDILYNIVTDWHRSPVLSFQRKTRNVISRISSKLVAK
ncbi:hypothetical protein F4774DRAFT_410133 [Daldinia eschscholtzii]|nr:hypothetical protein F4774DRAFT_410133 [Daldinia eschscholtzii]